MTNSLEGNPRQPIRDLVPKNVSFEARSLEGIRKLPHLQRVAGLVFLLLQAESVIDGQFRNEFEKYRDENFNEIQISFTDFILRENPGSTSLISEIAKGKKLPEIITEKLNERGNPFGFDPQVTRAILEMAKDELQTQIRVDLIKAGTYDPDSKPDPIIYFEEIMVAMLEEGNLSGMSPFSNTKFPAGEYHKEIFPREAAQQMRGIIEQIYRK